MTNSKYNFPNVQKVQIFEQVDTYIENNSNPIPHSSNHPTAAPSQTPPPTDSLKLFFSYAHKDEPLRDQLATHLSLLKRQNIITDWHDRNITAGTDWAQAIDDNLNTANIILLLISSDFLASDYCYDKEMTRALERHNQNTARVIPIILRPCDWHSAPLGKLQALPKDAKPITQWANQDEAFTHIAQGIRTAVAELQQRTNT
jgi:TIR domain